MKSSRNQQRIRACFVDGAGHIIVSRIASDGLAAINRAYEALMAIGAVWPLDVHLRVMRIA